MLRKDCPHCGKSSFSASDRGEWICPYCGEDISDVKPDSINVEEPLASEEDEEPKNEEQG